ncbi:catalase family peroxidase [Streptomyces sp. NPDC047002]|uniref:catalase family peroxidase n=1 Tax=Streptomyces sp. NPDC047002 TaxID=3155475 RepID=UPI003453AAEC
MERRSALFGLAAVGGIGVTTVGGFLYAGGRLRALPPERLTPARFADGLEGVFGRHPGFRRNHAKGVAVRGRFTATADAAALCGASVFRPGGRTPVTGRFSLSGGVPYAPDAPAAVRGLGLRFDPQDGGQWRTAMVDLPVFLDNTPSGFLERVRASKPVPATGRPDPRAMAAFLERHPETARAMKVVAARPATSGFADSTFHGLNAFYFTGGRGGSGLPAGGRVPVRWAMEPLRPVRPAGPVPGGNPAAPGTRDYLFDALVRDLSAGPLRWRLVVTVAEPGDPLDDATLPWPKRRRRVVAGTLTLDTVETEAPGTARDVNFDPLVLPPGIEPSDDPLLSARSAVYAQSYARRAAEHHTPSAVDVRQVLHG